MASNLGFRKKVLTNKVCNHGALFTSTTWLVTWGSGRRLSLKRCATKNIVYLTNMASNLGFRKKVLTNKVCNHGALFTSTTWLTTWGSGRRLSLTRLATREYYLPMASNLGFRKEIHTHKACNQEQCLPHQHG
jgi:hypothetical protein